MKLIPRILEALPIGDGRKSFWEVVKAYIAAGRYSGAFRKVFEHSGDIDYEEQVFSVCASTLVKPFDGNVCATARALIKSDDPYPARVEVMLAQHKWSVVGKGRDFGMAVQDLFLQLNADGAAITCYTELYKGLAALCSGKKQYIHDASQMRLSVIGESAAH